MTNNDRAMTDQERNYLEHHDPFILSRGIKDTSDYGPDFEDEDERRINEALRKLRTGARK